MVIPTDGVSVHCAHTKIRTSLLEDNTTPKTSVHCWDISGAWNERFPKAKKERKEKRKINIAECWNARPCILMSTIIHKRVKNVFVRALLGK